MAKQLKFSDDARQSLIKGIDVISKAVVTTLGPKGRNIALDKKWGAPNIVHDGVSVAKEIELKDPFENMGAQLVKEAASRTDEMGGDGTTTATLIASKIISEGMKALLTGINPMVLKQQIQEAVNKVSGFIDAQSKPVQTKEDIERVASVSAQDAQIGSLIAEARDRVGKDGVITVEEGRGTKLEIEYKEGMEFDRGFASAYFVTNPERMEAEIENPYILLTDKKITSVQDLLPFLEKFVKVSKTLVIIADEVEGEALATLVVNKLKGTFNVLAIKAPGFGDRRKETLEDISVLTGGTVLSEDTGRTFENLDVADLGQADKVWADKDNSRIIGGKGNPISIKSRIALLKRQITDTDSDFDKEKLEERLAKLSGGVAQINVGATTEIELNEKKERVKDAVGATKAAIEDGILPGGGVFLFEAREILPIGGGLIEGGRIRNFKNIGDRVLYETLDVPLRKILENAYGEVQASVIYSRLANDVEKNIISIAKAKKGKIDFEKDYRFLNKGHDVMTGKEDDMIKLGILDPAKVVKSALQNAASVAMMVLTTEGLVADIPEEKTPQTGLPSGGMGGMDY